SSTTRSPALTRLPSGGKYVIFTSSDVEEKIVREDTARSSPSSSSLFFMSPLRTWATSAPSSSSLVSIAVGLPFFELDLMTNAAGAKTAASRRQPNIAACRPPNLKNQRVKADPLQSFESDCGF